MTNTETLLEIAAARNLVRGAGPRIRAEAGVTIPEAAAAIGVAPSTLWRWERGLRTPRGAAAVRYAAVLGELLRVGTH